MNSPKDTTKKQNIIIGIDFDNTIINYDELMYALAIKESLIGPKTSKNKKEIRDTLRKLPGGDLQWQKIQAEAYGNSISKALLAPGIKEFLMLCREQKITVYIISHKTKYSNLYLGGTDLQQAALQWMQQQHFFDDRGLGLSKEQVFFEPTREQKVSRIKSLQCTHFIDDLEETFREPYFPVGIKKILYQPSQALNQTTTSLPSAIPFPQHTIPNLIIASTWQEITEKIIARHLSSTKKTADSLPPASLSEEEIKNLSYELLKEEIASLHRLEGGKNNQVYLLTTKNKKYVTKAYYTHPQDYRDRLQTEFSALSFLWGSGIRTIPQPLHENTEKNLAIYAYIKGDKITPRDITEKDIDAAISFLSNINQLQRKSNDFLKASDACFCAQDYLHIIQRRLNNLLETKKNSLIEKKLHHFLQKEFLPDLKETISHLQNQLLKIGYGLDTEIKEKILSPSDFGFHNALRQKGNQLIFLDFEYFGWDDPVKTISDFILHPGMQLDEPLQKRFAKNMLRSFDDPKLNQRFQIIFPLVGLIWCLLVLNEFVPRHQSRRGFALPQLPEEMQKIQLQKAERLLHYLKKHPENKLLER